MIGFRGVRIFVRLRLFASAQNSDRFNSAASLFLSPTALSIPQKFVPHLMLLQSKATFLSLLSFLRKRQFQRREKNEEPQRNQTQIIYIEIYNANNCQHYNRKSLFCIRIIQFLRNKTNNSIIRHQFKPKLQ